MLPKKTVQFFKSGARITRCSGGWTTNCCPENENHLHRSFITALQCIMFQRAVRLMILELEDLFPTKGITLDDCFQESPEGLLHVIRWSWMEGYLHQTTIRNTTAKRLRKKNVIAMSGDIAAMRKLQIRFPYEKCPSIWASLEEGCGQFQELLNIPDDKW